MTTAAYCELCGSNVYVRGDGTCPAGHTSEHLTGYYEVGGGGQPSPAQPGLTPVPRKPSMRRLALGVLIALVIFLVCGCVTMGAILLTDEDEPPRESTTASGAGDAGAGDAGTDAEEYPGEVDYLEEFRRIEKEASEAVVTLDELYPAQTGEDARELAEAADVLESAHASARELEAPIRYLAIHDHLVEGLRRYAEAVAIMESNGFQELDAAQADEASELWLQGAEEFQKMLDALEAFESVWGE